MRKKVLVSLASPPPGGEAERGRRAVYKSSLKCMEFDLFIEVH